MKILDSHVHFLDPQRPEGLVWPAADSPTYTRFLPANLVCAASCIAVETSRRPIDDAWLIDLAARETRVEGVVLNLQPDASNFDERFDQVADNHKFLGVRLRPIVLYDLSDRNLHKSLRRLEAQRKTVEFGASTNLQKNDFARLACDFPGTSWILDHGGHPPANGQPDRAWCQAMAAIAQRPNAFCKVTGHLGLDASRRAALAILLDLFGAQRLIYGSNQPVLKPDAQYADQLAALAAHMDQHAAGFFGHNARRAYGIAQNC